MSFNQQIVAGVRWTTAARLTNQILKLVLGIILARLLSPAEFGLMGMLLIFIGFAIQFSELGFGDALVQKKEIDESHRSSVFWFNLVVGLALTGGFAAAAPLFSWWFGEPSLIPLARVASLGFLFSASAIVQRKMYERSLSFGRVALVDVLATLTSGVVGITAAFNGLGVWALIIQLLSLSGLTSLGLWVGSPWYPRFIYRTQAIRDLWVFSINLTGFRFFNYWVRNFDNFIIGSFIGTGALGVYSRAYTTMLQPMTQVVGGIGQVMFPAFSKIQDDPAHMKRLWLSTNRIIGFLTFPMFIGLFVVAEPFVLGVLGPQWSEVAPVLQILCCAGFFQPVASTTGWLFRSLGKTGLMLRWQIVFGIMTCVAMGIGAAFFGIYGVSAGYAITILLIIYPAISVPAGLIDITFVEWLKNIGRSILLAVFMGGVVAAARWGLPIEAPLLDLGVSIVIGVIVYVGSAALVREPAFRESSRVVLRMMGRSAPTQ